MMFGTTTHPPPERAPLSKPVASTAGSDYRPTLLALTEAHASVVVLLSEGYDGVFVRSVLEQVLLQTTASFRYHPTDKSKTRRGRDNDTEKNLNLTEASPPTILAVWDRNIGAPRPTVPLLREQAPPCALFVPVMQGLCSSALSYDPAPPPRVCTVTRTSRHQALEVGLAGEGVQWFLSGAAAMDGIFTLNDTYRDAQLAYDFRGMMGARACPAIEGEVTVTAL